MWNRRLIVIVRTISIEWSNTVLFFALHNSGVLHINEIRDRLLTSHEVKS